MDDYRAGIMIASRQWPRKTVDRLLPPEHTVAAETHGETLSEYLIEGTGLPVVARLARPPIVTILVQLKTHEDDGYHLTCHWAHDPETEWTIGTWATFEAYMAEALMTDFGRDP